MEALNYTSRATRVQQTLQASSTQTDTGTGTAVSGWGEFRAIEFFCNLTDAATAAGDTLDVYVQTTIDGSNWVDVVHFTQILGDGGAKKFYAKLVWDAALTEFENGTSLSAAAQRSIMGDQYRCRWAITDVTTDNASFTFSVTANLLA